MLTAKTGPYTARHPIAEGIMVDEQVGVCSDNLCNFKAQEKPKAETSLHRSRFSIFNPSRAIVPGHGLVFDNGR
jgi:hypothetical protein